MMRFLFALFALLSVALAIEAPIKYAGTTANSTMFAPPTWDSAGTCTPRSTSSPYVVFNHTFASAGVWQVVAMAENDFKGSIEMYVYRTGFNAAMPCANTASQKLIKQSDLTGGPVIDDYVYVTAGVYFFVVTGSSATKYGIFAVNILPPNATGTTAGAHLWAVAYNSSDECYKYGGSTYDNYWVPYATYTWVHTDHSGYFDIVGYFHNDTHSSFEAYAVLFEGNVTTTGNITDPCNQTATNAVWLYGYYASSKGMYLAHQHLRNGSTYTVLVSGGYSDEWGYYGIQIVPTRLRFPNNVPGYTQPGRSSTPPACTASTFYTDTIWSSTVFTAEGRAYLLDTQYPPSEFRYFDTYAFMYHGLNTGVNGTSAPSACPLTATLVSYGDTGDITPVFSLTNPGEVYSIVVTSYGSPTYYTDLAYLEWFMTGDPIGVLPPPTPSTSTGGDTTSNPTTAQTTSPATTQTTSQTTTGQTTSQTSTGQTTSQTSTGATTQTNTGQTSTTATGSSTTSSASTLAASVLAVFIVLAALL